MKHALVATAMVVVCLIAHGQPSKGFDGKSFTTDDRIAAIEQWLKDDPGNLQNRTLLASAFIQKTRETNDQSYLERAAKLVDGVLAHKQDYHAMRLRNQIELVRHHFAKVVEYTREMTRMAPADPQNWGSLGDALLEMGRYDEARAAFEKMLALRRDLYSLNRMAYFRFVTGDATGAIEMMADAVKAGSRIPENLAWCLTELGTMQFKTGKLGESERSYREALRVFPASHAAWAGLGAVQAASGKLQDAIASYSRAQAMTPLVQYAGALHDLYLLAGDRAGAEKQSAMVDVVAQLDAAANQKANRTLALVYANQGRKLAEALEAATADLEVRQDVYTYDALGWVLLKSGRVADAQKAIEKAMALGTPEAAFAYHAGMIALAAGDKARGRELLEKALAMNAGFDVRQANEARKKLAEY